jgi:hypothetical protein
MFSFTASLSVAPAASATALRLSKTRTIWASMPSTMVMVAGSRPIWPDM